MRSYLRLMLKIYSLYKLFASWHIVVNVHVSSDGVTERRSRGVAVFRGRPLRHTPMMEWRRMDAALLVLLLGHLATALEVPLDLPQPPTITHQSPKDYIIDPRENIIIHCEAKGKASSQFLLDEKRDPLRHR
ncbi:Neuronal cell adhesion molecule [Larimichthys crocea]|uniref:Uncharacterized protein n=1 Tax=Larimichthys crocea TaxID=215358 RepID=A0ACD3QHE6_LARCR|nr:Neuronal cell adhesion molecule [Larimichthys crocea]